MVKKHTEKSFEKINDDKETPEESKKLSNKKKKCHNENEIEITTDQSCLVLCIIVKGIEKKEKKEQHKVMYFNPD